MVVTLQISLENDNHVFSPGEEVRGKVTLTNDAEHKVKGLTVTLYGEVCVLWTESEVRYNTVSPHRAQSGNHQSQTPVRRHVQREYRNRETVLCEEILVFGQKEADGGTDTILAPGTYEYRFKSKLPFVGLPTSFSDSPFGCVKYSIEARLKRPLFRYDRVEIDFVVNGILDLNFIPQVLQQYGANKQLELGWICCPSGSIALDVKLDKTGFVPGETLKFFVNVMNLSTSIIHQVQALLTQELEFITFDKTKQTSANLAFATHQYALENGAVVEWEDSFPVPPSLPPTNLAGCRIIRVNYTLTITANISEGKSLSVSVPITIGTGPRELHRGVITAAPPAYDSLTFKENLSSEGTQYLPYGNESSRPLNFDPSASRVDSVLLKSDANNTDALNYDPKLNPFLDSGESEMSKEITNEAKTQGS